MEYTSLLEIVSGLGLMIGLVVAGVVRSQYLTSK